jgi:hypothetical protein
MQAMLPEIVAHPDARANVLLSLGLVQMLLGLTEEGRANLASARAIADDLGHVPLAAADWVIASAIGELLGGDPGRVCDAVDWGVDALEQAQDYGHLATVAGLAAQVHLEADAEDAQVGRYIEIARRTVPDDDVDGLVRWRLADALRRASIGDGDSAHRLLEEARALIEPTEFDLLRVDLGLQRWRVETILGDPASAARGHAEALEAARAKGATEVVRRLEDGPWRAARDDV